MALSKQDPWRAVGSRSSTRRAPLTPGEAAAYLNVTPRFVRRLVAERRVPHLKVGRYVRFDVRDLDEYLERSRIEACR